MSGTNPAAQNYALREGVRVFRSGDEIRFRKGVWNYNEAVVKLTGQAERVVRFFDAIYDALSQGKVAETGAIAAQVGASPEESASHLALLENLRRQQFLQDPGQRDVTKTVSALLGGNLSGFEQHVGVPRPVLFFADTDYARDAAKTLARDMALPLDILDDDTARALATADLTTRTDAVAHAEAMTRFTRVVNPYSCVLGCVAAPNLTLLRNLNRVLVPSEKPLILGLVDGPFLSLMASLATQTGCFECYEQRMLARLQDTVVYHRFVESTRGAAAGSSASFAPTLHLLTAGVLSEAYLYSTLGTLRLAGRIVNAYLPLLEIQVQDLLRVPYCPACGFLSKAQMNEMYTSTKRLVDDMLARVEVKG